MLRSHYSTIAKVEVRLAPSRLEGSDEPLICATAAKDILLHEPA